MLLWVQYEEKGFRIRLLRLSGLAGEMLLRYLYYDCFVVGL